MDMLAERMEQRVEERVRAIRQQDVATTLESPQARHRSSCASMQLGSPDNILHPDDFPISGFPYDLPVDNNPHEDFSDRFPIDDIKATTKCKLLLPYCL